MLTTPVVPCLANCEQPHSSPAAQILVFNKRRLALYVVGHISANGFSLVGTRQRASSKTALLMRASLAYHGNGRRWCVLCYSAYFVGTYTGKCVHRQYCRANGLYSGFCHLLRL